jgi:thioredoxin 1
VSTTQAEIVTVTDDNFAEQVLGNPLPVLLEYWAEWCPPCKMIAPVLDEIAAEYAGQLVVAKINSDENPATTTANRVLGIPTMQVYRGGELVNVIVGARSKAALLRDLAGVLPAAA